MGCRAWTTVTSDRDPIGANGSSPSRVRPSNVWPGTSLRLESYWFLRRLLSGPVPRLRSVSRTQPRAIRCLPVDRGTKHARFPRQAFHSLPTEAPSARRRSRGTLVRNEPPVEQLRAAANGHQRSVA